MVAVEKKGLIYFWTLLHATAGKHLTLEKKKKTTQLLGYFTSEATAN